ncbi:unnamed protein product [Brachionus calyciflorus]|uniref:Uncharacterized protein n=1 Tax=Brachionus calyciflorus TaxID=104777 RepID=A0A814HLI8_9BILA|nr:unnamed protein product [Brachionus calyciflorus]
MVEQLSLTERAQKIKNQIKNNDPDFICLDLHDTCLQQKDIKEIEKLLINNYTVLELKGNEFYKNEKIEKIITRNLTKHKKFPDDYTHALLSAHIYSNIGKNNTVSFEPSDFLTQIDCDKRNRLLSDWKIQEIFNDKTLYGCYYGILYINESKKQIILSNKATSINLEDLKNPESGLRQNIDDFFWTNYVDVIETSLKISKNIYDKWVTGKLFTLSFTGHGIGGLLASLQCYRAEYEIGFFDVKAVVFNSPGPRINCQNVTSILTPYTKNVVIDNINLTSYITNPNFVNASNVFWSNKIYTFRPIKPNNPKLDDELNKMFDFKQSAIRDYVLDGILCLNQNGIENLLKNLEDQSTIKEIVDFTKLNVLINNINWFSNLFDIKDLLSIKFFNNGLGYVYKVLKYLILDPDEFKRIFNEHEETDEFCKNLNDFQTLVKALDLKKDFIIDNKISLRSFIDKNLLDIYEQKLKKIDFKTNYLRLLQNSFDLKQNSNSIQIVLNSNHGNPSSYDIKSIQHLRDIVITLRDLQMV